MKATIAAIILATQNDISEYLNSDVPLECNAADIDWKLLKMKESIMAVIDSATMGDPTRKWKKGPYIV